MFVILLIALSFFSPGLRKLFQTGGRHLPCFLSHEQQVKPEQPLLPGAVSPPSEDSQGRSHGGPYQTVRGGAGGPCLWRASRNAKRY